MRFGVVFDLDETLIDRTASITKYAAKLHDDVRELLATRHDNFVSEFLRLDGNGYVAREALFESLASYLSHPDIDASALASHFSEHAWRQPTLMSGAEECLRKLRSLGVPLGIITNGGSRNQRKKLRNTGLDSWVDYVVISEEFGANKPDPSIFLAACSGLDIDPADSWFVGDNPTLDIVGARAAGFRTIWLQRGVAWPVCQPTCYTCAVSSLEEALNAMVCDAQQWRFRRTT